MNDLYATIESYCKARKISITELCRASGAPRGSLTDLKIGAKILLMPPSLYYRYRDLYKLRKLATIFDVSVQAAFRCKMYYEQNENLLKNLSSYCPRCYVKVAPDYSLIPIDVIGDML